jgi:hypothetical protein
MARNRVYAAVKPIRELLESLGPPIAFRKLHGILNALEMQVEDGRFQKHAVTRLCEAMLATAELYEIDEETASRLESLTCGLIDLVQTGGGRA